jgi:hypothetical protein
MREAYSMVWSALVSLVQSNIQRRHQPKKLAFSAMDRVIFVWLHRLVPNTIKAFTIVKPDTVIRWHRAVCTESFVRVDDVTKSPKLAG